MMLMLPLPMPGSTQPKTTIDDNTRLMNKLYYIVSVMLVLASCAGSKHDTTDNSPYRRKPIVEVTESQLRADSAMIDATTQMWNYTSGCCATAPPMRRHTTSWGVPIWQWGGSTAP